LKAKAHFNISGISLFRFQNLQLPFINLLDEAGILFYKSSYFAFAINSNLINTAALFKTYLRL